LGAKAGSFWAQEKNLRYDEIFSFLLRWTHSLMGFFWTFFRRLQLRVGDLIWKLSIPVVLPCGPPGDFEDIFWKIGAPGYWSSRIGAFTKKKGALREKVDAPCFRPRFKMPLF